MRNVLHNGVGSIHELTLQLSLSMSAKDDFLLRSTPFDQYS